MTTECPFCNGTGRLYRTPSEEDVRSKLNLLRMRGLADKMSKDLSEITEVLKKAAEEPEDD